MLNDRGRTDQGQQHADDIDLQQQVGGVATRSIDRPCGTLPRDVDSRMRWAAGSATLVRRWRTARCLMRRLDARRARRARLCRLHSRCFRHS